MNTNVPQRNTLITHLTHSKTKKCLIVLTIVFSSAIGYLIFYSIWSSGLIEMKNNTTFKVIRILTIIIIIVVLVIFSTRFMEYCLYKLGNQNPEVTVQIAVCESNNTDCPSTASMQRRRLIRNVSSPICYYSNRRSEGSSSIENLPSLPSSDYIEPPPPPYRTVVSLPTITLSNSDSEVTDRLPSYEEIVGIKTPK